MSEFAMDDPSFYEDFLVEAQEHFELIEQNFLALEEKPNDLDILNSIFRGVHTIKGASGFLGLQKVQTLSHAGESVLDDLRKGRMHVDPNVMEILFQLEDTLKLLVNDVGIRLRQHGQPSDPDISELVLKLEGLRGAPAAAAPSSEQENLLCLPLRLATMDAWGRSACETILREGGELAALRIAMQPNILGTNFNPMSLINLVDLVGTFVHSGHIMNEALDLEAFEASTFPFDLLLIFQPNEPMDAIQKLFEGVRNLKIDYFHLTPSKGELVLMTPQMPPKAVSQPSAPGTPVATGPAAVPQGILEEPRQTPAASPDKTVEKMGSDTIRVSQVKLDSFMNTVAELIIGKTMMTHIIERLEAEDLPGEHGDMVKELRRAGMVLDHVSREIQASVLRIRMLPIKSVFTKFPRMLRDLAKASGKKIELHLEGEETEIDKSLIEELSDPLIHLIRNSADHGIELPAERLAAGKSETGSVTLRAKHDGDSIVVEIEDDGKGINPAVILAKAIEKGILSESKAALLSHEEILNLIFLPGFSTAQKVTDISGRGVGMDVVRSNVRRLGGSVGVVSELGKGSIFTLKLPLTLAIIDALLMRSGNQVFAIPGTAVEETLMVPPDAVSSLTRRKAINLRGEVLGVSHLNDLLRVGEGAIASASEKEYLPIVVLSSTGRRMGFIVDDFIRRQEMVIKPLAPYLASLPGISGASIMGDGGVVLILDPGELMQLAVQEAL